MFDLKSWERAEFLEAAKLVGLWMANGQCMAEHPWAGMTDSADQGRFLDKYKPYQKVIRPAGVWEQGLTITGLLALSQSPVLDRAQFRHPALLDERTYPDWAVKRLTEELGRQSPAGGGPNLGGTGVLWLEWLDRAELACQRPNLGIDRRPFTEAALRALRYAITLQERTSDDPLAHGGIYGEANYGLARTVLHARDGTYVLLTFLRVAGVPAPVPSALKWENAGPMPAGAG